MNLEKLLLIRTLQIRHRFKNFTKFFFKPRTKTATESKSFLNHVKIPKLSEDKAKICEKALTVKDLYGSLKSVQNEKSPGNDRLTKEFCETFWN